MTDGAIAALKHSGNQRLINRAPPYFLRRDPESHCAAARHFSEHGTLRLKNGLRDTQDLTRNIYA